MKRTFCTLAVFGLAMAFAAPTWAIDAKTFNCEKATVVELAKMSRFRGKCISTCVTKKQTKPGTYSCTPPFDGPGGGTTQDCADKTLDHYGQQITLKCTGFMPPCGGYEKGWCSNDTSLQCTRDILDCPGTCSGGFCTYDGVTVCTVNAECNGTCGKRCSSTTSMPCSKPADCPGVEDCVSAGVPKAIPTFIVSNLHDGDPLGPVDEVDDIEEALFACRQSVCSTSGDLCFTSDDCSLGETCTPGKCSNGTLCAYDGNCPAVTTTKKCIALGRCSVTPQSCRTGAANTTDCPMGEQCLRWGRCTGGTNNQQVCFSLADCPDMGGTAACTRTLVDTDRKTELKCTGAVTAALGKYTYDIANCQAKCALERDQKDGLRCKASPSTKCHAAADCPGGVDCLPTSCDPFATGRCSNDINQVCVGNTDCHTPGTCVGTTPVPTSPALQACRALAKAKALGSIGLKCPSLPTCGAYFPLGVPIGNFNRPEDLIGFVSGRADKQFREDNPDLSPGSNFCEP